MRVSIAGLNHAAVLAALYNAARPQGMGFLQYDPTPMTVDEARGLLEKSKHFDYLKGRVMKISVTDDCKEIEASFYDRDNGNGCAEAVIAILRKTGDPADDRIKLIHGAGVEAGAEHTRSILGVKSSFTPAKEPGGFAEYVIGLEDVKDELGPAVEKALAK